MMPKFSLHFTLLVHELMCASSCWKQSYSVSDKLGLFGSPQDKTFLMLPKYRPPSCFPPHHFLAGENKTQHLKNHSDRTDFFIEPV